MILCLACVAATLASVSPAPSERSDGNQDSRSPITIRLGGGGQLGAERASGHADHQCIPPSERAKVEARIAANRAALGLDGNSFVPLAGQGGVASDDPFDALLYRFWPQAGSWFTDLVPPGYVDVNPAPGTFGDYACHPFTYDGHAGIDSGLHSFEEKTIGVPVFAVLDGIVIDTHDGEPDEVVNGIGDANYIIIDHGLGRETWYFHLKTGSVSAPIGAFVKAGTQIGLTASSGYSFGPHLHFESRQLGQVFEPFAGTCRTGESGFVSQPPESLVNTITNVGVTDVNLSSVPGPPIPVPRATHLTFASQKMYVWLETNNLPANAVWRLIVKRPNGTVAEDTADFPFFNTELYRYAWFWWEFDIADMQSTAGDWSVEVRFDGVSLVTIPVTVKPTFDPNFNRLPAPFAANFEPATPKADDAITVRMIGPNPLDDLDGDVVRFQYQWKVDGSVVRSVISAGRSDMLPRSTATAGQTISCTVTPSDGKADGLPVTIAVDTPLPCTADLNGDGTVDAADLATLLGSWGLCE
jgi:murein DD-endopeptidase MepM/ murein hydrolase activator NlpD